jgi:ubiquinone/menaquinone biosynthesis C-methylase UbiE
MKELYNDSYLKKSTEFINHVKQESYKILNFNNQDVILEIGCGNGYDSIELAKKVLPTKGRVIGLDVDLDLVETSKKNAHTAACTNIEFIVGDAEKLPFEDNYFSIIRAERVFQHLKNPLIVFKEALRVLKPGGQLVLVETDWPGMNIYLKDLSLEEKIIHTLTHKLLVNGNASRTLLSYYIDLNVSNVEMKVFPVLVNEYKIANELVKFDHILEAGKTNNILTEKDIDEWNNNTSFLIKHNLFNLTANLIIFSGNKP